MRRFLSLMMLCLCCMAFVSCENTEDEYTGNKFRACAFVAMPTFGLDVFGFYDVTVTYTAMDGTVKELTADKDGSFIAEDVSYKLPATVKYEIKAVKKATYEEYKASKDRFDVKMMVPGYVAGWITQSGEETFAAESVDFIGLDKLSAERIDDYFAKEVIAKKLNCTFEGTYKKSENGGCYFEVKK